MAVTGGFTQNSGRVYSEMFAKMGTDIKTKGRPKRPPFLYHILYQDLSLYSISLFLKIHDVIMFIYT